MLGDFMQGRRSVSNIARARWSGAVGANRVSVPTWLFRPWPSCSSFSSHLLSGFLSRCFLFLSHTRYFGSGDARCCFFAVRRSEAHIFLLECLSDRLSLRPSVFPLHLWVTPKGLMISKYALLHTIERCFLVIWGEILKFTRFT